MARARRCPVRSPPLTCRYGTPPAALSQSTLSLPARRSRPHADPRPALRLLAAAQPRRFSHALGRCSGFVSTQTCMRERTERLWPGGAGPRILSMAGVGKSLAAMIAIRCVSASISVSGQLHFEETGNRVMCGSAMRCYCRRPKIAGKTMRLIGAF